MDNDLQALKARYDPEIQQVEDLGGLCMNAPKQGEMAKILRRSFFSSYDDDHRHYFTQVLSQFSGLDVKRLNEVLIVIRENTAHIYKIFPMMVNIRAKVPIEAGRAVFRSQILDISEVRFQDAVFEADIRDGDKIVWLFRVDWSFGLYFDFSEEMTTDELWKTLGQCYRGMESHSLYSFLFHRGKRRTPNRSGLVSVCANLGGRV